MPIPEVKYHNFLLYLFIFIIHHLFYPLIPAPVGLASPTVQITGPTSANVSWSELHITLYISRELPIL